MYKLRVLALDMRSTHNVGALLRTADCLGVDHVYLSGTSPYPKGMLHDDRLPHIQDKLDAQIHKTALGAEQSQSWSYSSDATDTIHTLKQDGWSIIALEQAPNSIHLNDYALINNTLLVLGTEVSGIPSQQLKDMDAIIEIPMHGKKESLNVIQATAIACYKLIN